ncbi:MAG: NAD(P)H-quinone oxidoreductase subunit 4, partial [Merismopedia sp. SIO2A8]|nr:NAD(P)H-quinone oxidoreductase subunit 4 [Merismopedia sp. SIO2A8]
SYDRTHTMMMDKMGGMGQALPRVFALFTAGAMASLALPGMSGFVSEISVFVGLASSDVYSATFRTVTIGLAAIGLVLTPIYLLSLLKEVFYGSGADLSCDVPTFGLGGMATAMPGSQQASCFGTSCELPEESKFEDANLREVFIAACFLSLIIAIGFYPKMATDFYDVKTVAVNAEVRESHEVIAESHPQIYATAFQAIPHVEAPQTPVLGAMQ